MTSREATQYLALGGDDSWPAHVPKTWKRRLTVIAFGAIQWPWLLRSLSGGPPAERERLLKRLGLPPEALPNLGSWKADSGFLNLMVDTIEAIKPKTVFELGTGASSLVIGTALKKNGGGKLISCDQHGEFVASTRDWLAENGLNEDVVEVRATPLTNPPGDWPGVWYDLDAVPPKIDMLVIDGPPWAVHPLVRGGADCLFENISVGGKVLLDDAARPGERVVARMWRKRWPNFDFKLVKAGTKGTLIGTRNS